MKKKKSSGEYPLTIQAPSREGSRVDAKLLPGLRLLVRLLKDEYPSDLSLEGIVLIWVDGVTPAELTALRAIETLLREK